MSAITISIWIRPSPMLRVNPNNQSIANIIAIVSNITVLPILIINLQYYYSFICWIITVIHFFLNGSCL